MKGAIFCLYSFCAFQTVFTNDESDEREMKKLRVQSVQTLHEIEHKLQLAVTAIGDAAYEKGVSIESIDNCQRQFNSVWNSNFIEPKIRECERCHDEAADLMDLEIAAKCCQEQIAELEGQAGIHRNTFNECISRCIHEMEVAAAAGPRGIKRGREG